VRQSTIAPEEPGAPATPAMTVTFGWRNLGDLV
jgi:hypothetical protein